MTNDTTAIILDPSVEGIRENHTYVSADAIWQETLTNGDIISGIASCNSIEGTKNTAYPQYNNQITQGYQNDGANCWCRMTNPVRSAWVFGTSYAASEECYGGCAHVCGLYVIGTNAFRRAVFGSAVN